MSPELVFYSHVEGVGEAEIEQLKAWADRALPECLKHSGRGTCELLSLSEVEISVVSDEAIAAVHEEFLDDPTATDVITFQHGELLVSFDTAKSVAASMEHSLLEELFLYVVHGLLHLNGHLDHEEADREIMHRIQNEIWVDVCRSRR